MKSLSPAKRIKNAWRKLPTTDKPSLKAFARKSAKSEPTHGPDGVLMYTLREAAIDWLQMKAA